MSAPLTCIEGAALEAPALPFVASRPTDAALLADVTILLGVIALIYWIFRAFSKNPWIPTSLSLAVLFYGVVDVSWWNTARVEVNAEGVTWVPWIGEGTSLGWAAIDDIRCEAGSLLPLIQDTTKLVLASRGAAETIEIPRFLDRFPDIAYVVAQLRPAAP